jgi:cytochrome c556
MRRLRAGVLTLPLLVSTGLWLPGCGEDDASPAAAKGPSVPSPKVAQSNPKIKEIMEKVGKGPAALQGSLGEAIKQTPPAWDTIQSKSKEYSDLASQLSKLDPIKGEKDSWNKLTLAFAETAAGLDKSAMAKDKDHTQEALDGLGSSCMACHRQHRVMGPGGGRGGMGGPPGGMRPGGGPPDRKGGPGPGPPPP